MKGETQTDEELNAVENAVTEADSAVTENQQTVIDASAEEEVAVADSVAVEEGVQLLVGGEEKEEEAAVTDIGSCGDFLIEEFSIDSHVRKLNRFLKIPEKIIHYLFSLVYLAVGVLCIVIPKGIEHTLPYIVGGALAVGSLLQFIYAIATREYRKTNSNKTASSVILMGLAVMIIIEHQWAHTFIPIVWGILGLCEGAHAFNQALIRISRGKRASYFIIKGIIELAVAFLLLYKPETYGELHIMVFGVSLIIDGITTLPFIKNFISGR